MKKLLFAVLLGFTIASCSNKNDQSLSFNVKQIKSKSQGEAPNLSNMMKIDSVLLVPLEKIYSNSILELINTDEYVLASNALVMGFIVRDGKIFFGNSEKSSIFSIDLSDASISTVTTLSTKSSSDRRPICKLTLVNDELYVSNYDESLQLKWGTWEKTGKLLGNFSKSGISVIRSINKYETSSITKMSEILKDKLVNYMLSPGYDQCSSSQSKEHFVLLTNQPENAISLLRCTEAGNIKKILIEFADEEMDKYEDVDIVYLDSQEIKFVLKTSFPEDDSDVFVVFDLVNNKVLSTKPLSTLFIEPTFFGDPASFPVGSTYTYSDNYLWRMRTTKKGLCFENWKI